METPIKVNKTFLGLLRGKAFSNL